MRRVTTRTCPTAQCHNQLTAWLGLAQVLEYVQDSKSTLFLVLELVTGSELFDRVKVSAFLTHAETD